MRDWSPLSSTDPVPGDACAVDALAGRLERRATAIKAQADQLKAITAEGVWAGRAADTFREHHREVPPRLTEIARRYEKVSASLKAYHAGLVDAQELARQALAKARAADRRMRVARRGVEEMQRHDEDERCRVQALSAANPTAPPVEPLPWVGPRWDREVDEAEGELATARGMLDRAVRAHHEAASGAAGDIREASDDSLKDDSGFFAKVRRGAAALADAIPLETIAKVLSVAGAVLAIAALIFPVLTPLALAVGLAGVIADGILATAGRKGWGAVALDLVGVAAFGVGRVFTTLARGARTTAAAGRATRLAQTSPKGMRALAPSNRRGAFTVTGKAARRTLIRQAKTVRNLYPARPGIGDIVRQGATDLRLNARVLRTGRLRPVLDSNAQLRRELAGRIDIPRVVDGTLVDNMSPAATRLTRIAYGAEVAGGAVEAWDDGYRPAMEARDPASPGAAADRGRTIDPAPVG